MALERLGQREFQAGRYRNWSGAIENADASGTASILDMEHVAPEAQGSAVAPISETEPFLVIYQSRIKAVRSVLASLVMLLLSVWMFLTPAHEEDLPGRISHILGGHLGPPTFTLILISSVLQAFAKKSLLVFDDRGITTRRCGLIPWSAIATVRLNRAQNRRFFAIIVRDIEMLASRYPETKARNIHFNQKKMGMATGIHEATLPMKVEQLLARVGDYCEEKIRASPMNMTTLEQECREAVAQSFQHLRERLVSELRTLLGATYAPGTTLFWFVYDSPHFDDSFPVTFCPMDRAGEPAQVRRLLPEVMCTVPNAVLDDPRYEASGLDTWEIASEVLVPWFAECWQEAGGPQSGWPGSLAQHDSDFFFDLTARRERRLSESGFPGT